MHPKTYAMIQAKPEYKEFIRFHPEWYRTLTKHPEQIDAFVDASKVYHGQTMPQRIERFQRNMDMALMILKLLK
ncbi:YlbE-like protein [Alteribacillus persepolensis]|uniref:YlbE-like protein n=1 Tax=Alteribacillus persepolensis TaxID=568899 RepID=A0A1G7YBZ1_9BACI|nr:YlbE-like family protein [Alteribacillus persepolensis]SDG93991.1 YlbE-like protein [Alteribacillus persepolensis]